MAYEPTLLLAVAAVENRALPVVALPKLSLPRKPLTVPVRPEGVVP